MAMWERLSFGSWSPPYLRAVLYIIAQMLIALSVAMLLPALVDFITRDPNWRSFLISSGLTFACGLGLSYSTRCRL